MSIQRKEVQREQERRARGLRQSKQREMHDLLTFVQGQIHGTRKKKKKTELGGVRERRPGWILQQHQNGSGTDAVLSN